MVFDLPPPRRYRRLPMQRKQDVEWEGRAKGRSAVFRIHPVQALNGNWYIAEDVLYISHLPEGIRQLIATFPTEDLVITDFREITFSGGNDE